MTTITISEQVVKERSFPAKECPFCQSDKLRINSKTHEGKCGSTFYVACVMCDGQGPEAFSKEKAINKWNGEFHKA